MTNLTSHPLWPWLSLPALLILTWAMGTGLGKLTRVILARLTKRTAVTWDDELVARLAGPITWVWAFILALAAVPWMGWSLRLTNTTTRGLRVGVVIMIFWGLWRSIGIIGMVLGGTAWVKEHFASSSLAPLLARISKVLLLIFAVVAVLSDLGYPVASIVAGLGIGGLAVALAAKSTLENLFGAFSIAADRPFREGDFVKVEDVMGTVESVGLRSTRLRTLDRTLVSMPNGKLADMRIESFAARDRIRLACVLGLMYGTTSEQMRSVLAGWEGILRGHPKIWPDTVVVRFKEIGSSSLDIEVMAWFQTQDFGEFQGIRQEILLQFMEVVEKAGTSFAFPTRTVHLVTDDLEKLPPLKR